MIELDQKYVDVIIKRWQNLTNKKATLSVTGEAFDDILKKVNAKK
jgi:DNA modification methylase